eukprot:TRINITY_DN1278_c1_g1_i2.p1 TRINITY_DN1278_c1_g1~~TRINITY_DN1278_c1_g1_i2.p1  ORF type:complete len:431 (-),score=86.43 TRINITY_DN1278_c1_g1_i2:460-1752(-)
MAVVTMAGTAQTSFGAGVVGSSGSNGQVALIAGLAAGLGTALLVAIIVMLLVWRRRRNRREKERLFGNSMTPTKRPPEVIGGHPMQPVPSSSISSVSGTSLSDDDHHHDSLRSASSSQGYALASADSWVIPFQDLVMGEELGRGAFGVVRLAYWRHSPVVVKQVIHLHNSGSFRKEAEIMKRLRPHPNVVLLLGVCIDPVCIVSEYLSAGSLHGLIMDQKASLGLTQCLTALLDIARGMAHLHAEKLLHCDLAARNVLIEYRNTTQFTAKICDFGLAHQTGQEDDVYLAPQDAKLPVRWTSPETLKTKKFTKANDVWAFGITAVELLARDVPYGATTPNNHVMLRQLEGYAHPERPKRISYPDELWNLLLDCWAEEPTSRPSFDDLCTRVESIVALVGPPPDFAASDIERQSKGTVNEGTVYKAMQSGTA